MLKPTAAESEPSEQRYIYRHSLVVRLTHWVNVLCLVILLMSGLQIFNAHSALYFGEQSDFQNPALVIAASRAEGKPVGITRIFGYSFQTTGVLGLSSHRGELTARAFPSWITLPADQDLAAGRRWHFFFAWLFVLNGLVYLTHGLISGHVRHDLLPSRAGLARIGATIIEHLRLRFPRGAEARRYNVLEQIAYLVVIFLLLPAMVLSGWAMSPGLNAAFPPLVDLFGGRQSARTIHFIAATAVVLFVVVHVVMVLVSGAINRLGAMITGRYDVGTGRSDRAA